MKKRCMALFLAVIVAFGGLGLRPQKAYASPALAVPACEIVYALLASAGLVVAANATGEEKLSAVESFYNRLDATGKSSVLALTSSMIYDEHTGLYQFLGAVSPNLFLDFRSAFDRAYLDFVSYAPPVAGYTPYTLPRDGSGNFKDLFLYAKDSAFFVIGHESSSLVATVLPSGLGISYKVDSLTGKFTLESVKQCGVGGAIRIYQLRYQGFTYPNYDGFNFSWGFVDSLGTDLGGGFYGNGDLRTGRGIAWGGSATTGQRIIGSPSLTGLSYMDGVSTLLDGLVPADEWAKHWSDTVSADNAKVGIWTGKDLTGIDTKSGAYEHLLEGIAPPDVLDPDVPLDPPATGDLTGISGLLKKIWEWLQGCLDDLIAALTALFSLLFVPTAADFQASFDPFLNNIQSHFDLNAYKELVEGLNTLESPYPPNITAVIFGKTYTVVDFKFFNEYRPTIFFWTRGVFFILLFIYNLNFVYRVIRSSSLTSGSGANTGAGSSSGKTGI